MDVENIGPNTLDVTTVDLALAAGMTDVRSDYTVVADPANPVTIASGATATFTFAVDVSAMATLGTIDITGVFAGVDQMTAAPAAASGADVPDSWDVIGAQPFVRTVDAVDATVSQGSIGHAVTVDVENTGLTPLTSRR